MNIDDGILTMSVLDRILNIHDILLMPPFDRFDRYIFYLLDKGANLSKECAAFVVHKYVALGHGIMLNKLVNTCGLSPVLMTKQSHFCYIEDHPIKQNVIDGLSDVFSPLCMALLCGHIGYAEALVKSNFLTFSDRHILSNHEFLRELFEKMKRHKSIEFLEGISELQSLEDLCLASISCILSFTKGRDNRIDMLGVPPCFQRALKFEIQEDSNWEYKYVTDCGLYMFVLDVDML